jgi:N6-L-threonylcarbamoyladenine synthase
MVRVLGIESSCDETAAAIVVDGRHVESSIVASQEDVHRETGGVVPEVASRLHLRAIGPVVERAFSEAGRGWSEIDLIAVTHGPGLAGALLVGLNTAKALAFARGLPLLGVNHLEGHVYANWLVEDVEPRFPVICLIVSGGHSDIVLMRGHGQYERLGWTLDDAPGEAFDKAARMMGLRYPGGPSIQRAAVDGDPTRYPLPRAWLRPTWNFSFSGLKTAVHRTVREAGEALNVPDLAASFQEAVVDVLATKAVEAAREYGANSIALAGGVASNLALRGRVQELSGEPFLIPPVKYCTDNAAMIASVGYFRHATGATSALDLDVIPVLPIDSRPGVSA